MGRARPREAEPGSRDALDLASLTGSLGVALRLAQIRIFNRFYADLHDLDVGPGEITVLTAIGNNPGVRQGVLAAALAIKRSNMAKLVTALQRRQFVERQVPATDRRAVELYLTPAGRAFVEAVLPRVNAHDASASADALTADERATLLGLLQKLAGAGIG